MSCVKVTWSKPFTLPHFLAVFPIASIRKERRQQEGIRAEHKPMLHDFCALSKTLQAFISSLMKGKTILKPGYEGKSSALQALRVTKISLLIILLGVCVVGKRKSTWPVVSWALYSGYSARFQAPEPAVSVTELRVYSTAGALYVVKPEQVLTLPRDSLSHKIVEQAFDGTDMSVRNESRRYLMGAVSNLLGADTNIETIQAWQLSYPIDPWVVPPIQVRSPATESMLGSFSREDLTASE